MMNPNRRQKSWCQVPGCNHVMEAHGRCSKHVHRLKAREALMMPRELPPAVHASFCECGPCVRNRDALIQAALQKQLFRGV